MAAALEVIEFLTAVCWLAIAVRVLLWVLRRVK